MTHTILLYNCLYFLFYVSFQTLLFFFNLLKSYRVYPSFIPVFSLSSSHISVICIFPKYPPRGNMISSPCVPQSHKTNLLLDRCINSRLNTHTHTHIHNTLACFVSDLTPITLAHTHTHTPPVGMATCPGSLPRWPQQAALCGGCRLSLLEAC